MNKCCKQKFLLGNIRHLFLPSVESQEFISRLCSSGNYHNLTILFCAAELYLIEMSEKRLLRLNDWSLGLSSTRCFSSVVVGRTLFFTN